MWSICLGPIGLTFLALIATSISAQKPELKSTSLVVHKTNEYTVEFLNRLPIEMTYKEFKSVSMIYKLNQNIVPKYRHENVIFHFKTVTTAPEFPILKMDGHTYKDVKLLSNKDSTYLVNLTLEAAYIGHAYVELRAISFANTTQGVAINLESDSQTNLPVVIKQNEGVWGTVFIVSVSILLLISYINLGAQMDGENVENIIKNPKTLILGVLISITIMPAMSWLFGKLLLEDHMIYRVGAFVFAVGPAATASSLWAVMLEVDKELSVGLQIASNLVGLLTMPASLYLMELAVISEGSKYVIKVPYFKLIQAILLIILALAIGKYVIGRYKQAQKISTMVFRPMTFGILLFIIGFSSILYWHIYTMFSWTITLTTFLIIMSTYLVSGFLAYIVNRSRETSVAISIGSAYKNSGIAYGVLLVAFGAPDMYIAFVPALTQVLTTSLLLYLFYTVHIIIAKVKRRGQPDPIQATTTSEDVEAAPVSALANVQPKITTATPGKTEDKPKEKRSSSITSSRKSSKSTTNEGENEEMVAMNVTDSVPGSPASVKSRRDEEGQENETQKVGQDEAKEDNKDENKDRHEPKSGDL